MVSEVDLNRFLTYLVALIVSPLMKLLQVSIIKAVHQMV